MIRVGFRSEGARRDRQDTEACKGDGAEYRDG